MFELVVFDPAEQWVYVGSDILQPSVSEDLKRVIQDVRQQLFKFFEKFPNKTVSIAYIGPDAESFLNAEGRQQVVQRKLQLGQRVPAVYLQELACELDKIVEDSGFVPVFYRLNDSFSQPGYYLGVRSRP